MASPQQPDAADPGENSASPAVPDDPEDRAPRVLRLRIVPWDVVCTVVLLLVLLFLVSATSWPTQLFAFAENLCPPDECPPVPYGVNYYILPVMWGGIGAAAAAALLGPFVSLLRGWYMSFWPVIAVAVLTLASVLGYALAGFSERYYH